jgi:phage major head subunit gpT-like protein
MMIRSQFSDLFTADALPALEELFRFELARHPSVREKLFKVVTGSADIYQTSELGDLPLWSEVPEGTGYTLEKARQGYDKTMVYKKFGSGFQISEETVDDGKINHIADLVAKLAKSARETQEIYAMNVINNGFSSATTPDGQPLFSASHTFTSGLGFSNILTNPADLSDSSLRQMLVDFEKRFIGDTGIQYLIKPKTLLVAPENKRLAMELLGSELRVNDVTVDNSNTNAMNALRSEGIQVVSSVHLTDTDAFYLLADPAETGLRIAKRKDIVTKGQGPDEGVGFMNDSIIYKAKYREEIAPIHALGVMGTPGS